MCICMHTSIITLDLILKSRGCSYWNFMFVFFVGWANLLNLKMFQGSEATIPILLVPKYIPGYNIWLLLIPLSVFLAYPHTLLTSYPPNLLPSSSLRPRIQFRAPNPSKQITLADDLSSTILRYKRFTKPTLPPSYPHTLLPS